MTGGQNSVHKTKRPGVPVKDGPLHPMGGQAVKHLCLSTARMNAHQVGPSAKGLQDELKRSALKLQKSPAMS
ncbi:hypothetical protein GCM10025871_06810 [Deinococcus metallilatus]|nr:hypothetical protein GCM10025871_06810 [Deinococcus metallilatus]